MYIKITYKLIRELKDFFKRKYYVVMYLIYITLCTLSLAEKVICPWNEMVTNDMVDGGQTQPSGVRQWTNSPWWMLYTLTVPSCEPETAMSSSVAIATQVTGRSWPRSVWNGFGFVLFELDTSHTTEVQSLEPLIMYHPHESNAKHVTTSRKTKKVRILFNWKSFFWARDKILTTRTS